MKKNKIVVLAGMALLMVGTILNVHDALNEFGVMEISLHPQVMAQTGTTSGTTTNMGNNEKEQNRSISRNGFTNGRNNLKRA